MPSLRERPEDIEPLVRHFQDEYNHSRSKLEQKQFRISTVNEMMKYNWSGNVRELQNAAVQMMANAQSDIINPSDFILYRDRGFENISTTPASSAATLFEVCSPSSRIFGKKSRSSFIFIAPTKRGSVTKNKITAQDFF